jgi:GPH family glycoside/pentoside/hexuronide:cation symporter
MKKYNQPWRYALAMLGVSITGYMYRGYGTYFYTEKAGLTMAAIGIGNIFFAVWDAFNDPIAGYLSDRTRSRWGRRRPWLLPGAVVFCLASILFFSPPASLGTGTMLAVWFTFFLMLTETANTISTVNYHSLLPELFREEGPRNSANAIRQALQLVGMILGVSLTPLVAGAIGYRLTAVLMSVLGSGLIIYSILGTKERQEFSEIPAPGLWESLKAITVNRNFWPVALSHFFYLSASSLLLVGIPFFVKYSLGAPESMATVLSAAVFVSAIPSMFLWYKLINRFGAVRAWRTALIWLGAANVLLFFAREIVFGAIAGAFVGIGLAGVTANLDLINSRLIEEDASRYGYRREGFFFAGISFITHLSSLVQSGVFLLLYFFFHFESGANPGDNPAAASRFMMTVFPAVLMLISVGISYLVKFGKVKEE